MQNLAAATRLLMSSKSAKKEGRGGELMSLLAEAFRFNIQHIHKNVGNERLAN
jgi:hypothetical protein